MAVRSFRLPDDLDRRLSDKALQDDRSVSYVIVRALEEALATEDGSGEDARVSPAILPTPPRASDASAEGSSQPARDADGASRSAPGGIDSVAAPPARPAEPRRPKQRKGNEDYVIPKVAPRRWAQ